MTNLQTQLARWSRWSQEHRCTGWLFRRSSSTPLQALQGSLVQDGGLFVRLELERGLSVGRVDCDELLAVAEQCNESRSLATVSAIVPDSVKSVCKHLASALLVRVVVLSSAVAGKLVNFISVRLLVPRITPQTSHEGRQLRQAAACRNARPRTQGGS